MTNRKLKPFKFGQGPSGKPAIEWWRHGVAAAGEPSVVTVVREYESDAARQGALFAPEPADPAPNAVSVERDCGGSEHIPVQPSAPFNPQAKAPISAAARLQLSHDAKDVRGAAHRKGLSLDRFEEARQLRFAKEHFELGCWLHYFRHTVGHSSEAGFQSRAECAMRIFLGGIQSPSYDFCTVFDFGEREFDTIFEMGDSARVIGSLRAAIPSDPSGLLKTAFDYHSWPY